jgi:hypothetical protein
MVDHEGRWPSKIAQRKGANIRGDDGDGACSMGSCSAKNSSWTYQIVDDRLAQEKGVGAMADLKGR